MNKKYIFVLLFISSIVIFSWFRNGNFFAGGEESLSTWNSIKMASTYGSSWIDMGLGYPSPFWLPRIPVYFFTYLLSYFFNPSTIQAILFWVLTSSAGIGMYFLAKYFFGENRKTISLLAGLFYILNLYTQSQVWARFVFAGFFAWASLPLLLFLWIKWFSEGKCKHLFLFGIFSVLFSSAYSHPAFIISFWSVSLLFSIFRFKKTYIPRIVLGIFIWTLFNIWWIYPYFKLQSTVISNIHDWKYDLASLGGVSVDSKISDVLLLRHKFFFERLNYWGNFYKGSLSYFVSFAILAITIFGFVKARILKEYKYLMTLAIIGLFICKGTNPPLGNALFGFLFENVSFARAFRSSYEKFGTVWLMVYSLFFAYGFGFIYQKATHIWKFILVGFFIPLTLIVLVWPMWGQGPFSPAASVRVPNDYKVADDYVKALGITGRILSLPMIPGEGVKYDWGETSYYGLEPSDILFSDPVVSKTVRYNLADDKYMSLYNTFTQNKNIDNLLSEMDIEYFILHNEIDPKYSNASSSAEIKENLKKYSQIKFLKSIGFLDIYKNLNYTPNNYQKISPGHYVVNVTNANKPFKIILRNSFSPLWIARINKEVIFDHFVAYGYANAWDIDKAGSYRVDLIFKIWPWQ
ncbi:MAG: hypothetical protein AAB535_00295 [Patescibacteria group bacterium]